MRSGGRVGRGGVWGVVGSCRYEGNVIKLFLWNEEACRGGKGTSEEVSELCCYLLSSLYTLTRSLGGVTRTVTVEFDNKY